MKLKMVQFSSIDLDGFKSIIKNAVATALQENKNLFSQNLNKFSDEYLTRKEAAEFLKISETTLWNLDKTQVLPAIRLNGKVLYLKSHLLDFSRRSA